MWFHYSITFLPVCLLCQNSGVCPVVAPTSEIPRGQEGIICIRATCQLPQCRMEAGRKQCLFWVFFLWSHKKYMKGLNIHISIHLFRQGRLQCLNITRIIVYVMSINRSILPCYLTHILLNIRQQSCLVLPWKCIINSFSSPTSLDTHDEFQFKSSGEQICFHYLHKGNCL